MKKISRRSFIEFSAYAAGALGGLAISPSIALRSASAFAKAEPQEMKFVNWSYGGIPFANPVSAQSMDFRFWFSPVAEKRKYSFREEVYNACRLLDKKRNGKPIALCLGAGVWSEAIGNTLMELGIPFEVYFVDIWQLNSRDFYQWADPIAKRWEKDINVFSITCNDFFDYSKARFETLGCESPTALAMTFLFSKIPADRLIVMGDGALDFSGSLYTHLGNEFAENPLRGPRSLLVSGASVVYENWAQLEGRQGVFYFYRSTPGLVAATLTDPKFQVSYPTCNAKEVFHAAFPEIKRRPKSTNWNVDPGSNFSVRKEIQLHAQKVDELKFWTRLHGTIVQPDAIFRG